MAQDGFDRLRFLGMRVVNLVALVAVLVMYNTWATKAQAHDELVSQQIAETERAANRGSYATDGAFEGETLAGIDVVSGATYSSNAIAKACYDALKKAAAAAGSSYEEPTD